MRKAGDEARGSPGVKKQSKEPKGGKKAKEGEHRQGAQLRQLPMEGPVLSSGKAWQCLENNPREDSGSE